MARRKTDPAGPVDRPGLLPSRPGRIILICAVLGAGLIAAWVFFFVEPETLKDLWQALADGQIHPAGVAAAYLLLPVFGFPVVPLLVLLGLRFGPLPGVLIMCAVMPFHLAVAFWVTRYLLYDRFHALVNKRQIPVNSFPEDRQFKMGLLFMAVPGLSYTLKNYLLPLSGMTAGRCVLVGWLAQSLMGIPFVVLGHAVSGRHLVLVMLALVFFAASFAFFRKRLVNVLKAEKES